MDKGVIMEVDSGRGRKTDKLELERKDRWLAKQGFKVLRFTEEEISEDMNKVMEEMWESFLGSDEAPSLREIAASSAKARSEVSLTNAPEHITNYEDTDQLRKFTIATSGRNE
jgi:hypothetical protein